MTELNAGDAITISLELFPIYIMDLPMMIAITIYNPNPKRTYYSLPKIDWFNVPPPVEFIMENQQGETFTLPVVSTLSREGAPTGFRLAPNQALTILYDLSTISYDIPEGDYTLTATYESMPAPSISSSTSFKLIGLEAKDKLLITQLLKSENWNSFLLSNNRSIHEKELRELNQDTVSGLSLHLFLHRAIYGPDNVADLDTSIFKDLAKGPLKGESSILQHEILLARQDSGANELAEKIIKQWPGLSWRIDENLKGYGRLSTLRKAVGAESLNLSSPDPAPYTEEDND